jgi:plasmid stabilization system protein ParE
MAKSIVVRPRAHLDLVELAEHIGKSSVIAADRFLDACTETFNLLADSPFVASPYPTKNTQLADLRFLRVRGFPNHVAFFVERTTGIEVVRVVQGSRDLDAALLEQ